MDTECSSRPLSRSSHTSTRLEQDMVILRSMSPSIRPGTLFPEPNTGSNPHEDVSHDADVGLQQHLLGFERAEEKLTLLHHQRHEQVMGVQEQMLIDMREMRKILKNTNQHICQHNQFMASISKTLIKLHDQSCAATPATTSTATLFPTVEVPLFSLSPMPVQLQQSVVNTPPPPN
ncbi:hypothetical protein FKM82_006934 [Ascaphus truei]